MGYSRSCATSSLALLKRKRFALAPVSFVFLKPTSFTVQNPRAQLIKIDHVILLYLSSANSDSALLTIMHTNRAFLKISSASRPRLAEVEEKYISLIINEPIQNKIEEDNNLERFHVQR